MSSISSQCSLPGGTGMPYLGLGTFTAKDKDVKDAVHAALDAGYRSIDTALSYGNEAAIGEALQEAFASKKYKREDIFVTTKIPGNYLGSREHVMKAFTKSLTALQLDYVDLYLIHSPVGFQLTPKEELFPRGEDGKMLYAHHDFVQAWQVLEELVANGKARAIGVSNFNAKQISRLLEVAKVPIATNQVECHAYFQQRKLRQFCAEKGISITAYAPIGSPGFMNTKCEEKSLPVLIKDPVVAEIAAAHGKTPSQVLLRFLVDENVIVIPKSANPGRIAENANIFNLSLTVAEKEKLNNLDRNLRYFDFIQIAMGHPEYPFSDPY